jgi:hypothetical protein
MVEQGLAICSAISDALLDPNGQVDDIAAETFQRELGYLGSFIQSLLSLPPLMHRDIHFGIAPSAFDFTTRAISIIESPIIPQPYRPAMAPAIETLATYASLLCAMMPEQMTVPKALIHPTISSALDRISTPSPPAEHACAMMRHARSIQFCFAPGCPESAQSSGRVYMHCSGCHVVAYSSKECQKRAWTDKQLPHRDICKKMKQVYDIGGDYLRKEDQDKFVREIRRAKINDATLKEIGMWLNLAYAKLQRNGPLLTAEVREYLSQKKEEGPIYVEGMEEYLSKVKLAVLSNPKRRKGRM